MTPGEARYKPLSTFNTVMILISYPGLWASQEAVVPYERPILPILLDGYHVQTGEARYKPLSLLLIMILISYPG
jgi:hypothetical protein